MEVHSKEQLETQQPLRARVALSVPLFGAFLVLGLFISSLGPSITYFARTLEQPETRFGQVFAARGVGYLLGSLASGHSAQCVGGLRFIVIGVAAVLMGLSGVAALVSPGFYVMASVIFFLGCAAGTVDAPGNAAIVEVHGQKVGPWMQALHFSFSLGALLSPLVIGVIGVPISYSAFSVLALVLGALAIYNGARRPHFTPVRVDESPKERLEMAAFEGSNLERRHYGPGEGDGGGESQPPVDEFEGGLLELAAEQDGQAKDDSAPPGLAPMPTLLQVLLCAFFFCYTGLEVGFGGWLPVVMTLQGVDEAHGAYTATMFWLGVTIGRVAAIPLAALFSVSVLLQGLLAGSLVWTVAALILGQVGWSEEMGLAAAFGVCLSAMYPLAMSLPVSLGINLSGRNSTWLVVGGSLGEMIIPLGIGELIRLQAS